MCSHYQVYNMATRDEQTPNCSICLDELTCPVKTNCGHTFCAQCMLSHWRHDRWPNPCRCPVCRREVTLLMGADDWSAGASSELFREVGNYNQQMSNREFGYLTRLRDAPVLLGHLWGNMGAHLPFSTKLYFLAVMATLFVYLISPIDVIPEFIFGVFGMIDDVIVIFYAVVYLAAQYREYVVNFGQRQR